MDPILDRMMRREREWELSEDRGREVSLEWLIEREYERETRDTEDAQAFVTAFLEEPPDEGARDLVELMAG
jgi:hypothetical protein